jgi:hypothetical protein
MAFAVEVASKPADAATDEPMNVLRFILFYL